MANLKVLIYVLKFNKHLGKFLIYENIISYFFLYENSTHIDLKKAKHGICRYYCSILYICLTIDTCKFSEVAFLSLDHQNVIPNFIFLFCFC